MYANFSDLVGKVIVKINGDKNSDVLEFICQDGSEYKMYHEQDCCESVYIEDIDGNLSRLLGLPITIAEESSNEGNVGEYGDTCTWTFYKLGNVIDTITIRWYGSSNGYYSESANFYQTKEANKEVKMAKSIGEKIESKKKEIEVTERTIQQAVKLAQVRGEELIKLHEELDALQKEQDLDTNKIEKAVATCWEGVYEKPEWLSVKFVDVNGEVEKCIDISISKQYNHPALTFAVLKRISNLFNTDRIDTYDEWSQRGCDTCDYGSSYGYAIRVLPNEKGGKFTFKLD